MSVNYKIRISANDVSVCIIAVLCMGMEALLAIERFFPLLHGNGGQNQQGCRCNGNQGCQNDDKLFPMPMNIFPILMRIILLLIMNSMDAPPFTKLFYGSQLAEGPDSKD